ncbi:unnamed protein product [Periconia digitata]|uniref:Uncharacterized protein n=1 Tax=Periconia digitata TaxID=1303443 RepID=A0A9W4USY7_9PLEO|nr:unnamed protein product [Periconia digitata]
MSSPSRLSDIEIPESVWPNRPRGYPPAIWYLAPYIPAFKIWEEQGGMRDFMEKHGLEKSLMDSRARREVPYDLVKACYDMLMDLPGVRELYAEILHEHNSSYPPNPNAAESAMHLMAIMEGWDDDSEEEEEEAEKEEEAEEEGKSEIVEKEAITCLHGNMTERLDYATGNASLQNQ